MQATPEVWVPPPGPPSPLQARFEALETLAEGGTKIVTVGYDPTELIIVDTTVATTPITVTPNGGNIGNGTVNNVVPGVSVVEETWTLTATSSTNFTVVGTTSGAKAAATVGTLYDNGFLSFTIVAGTTPFSAGDIFTIVFKSNGTMVGVSLLPGSIVETWTMTCKATTSLFTVVGSVSGSKPDLTVNSPYNNSIVSLHIQTGTIPFLTGKVFSFQVQLANPETAILGSGYTQNYKELTGANLTEVIYTL